MQEKALDINYTAFGGIRQVDSEERRVQEQRETRIPMEYYMDISSIPPSPKEPPNPYPGEASMTLSFGEPSEQTVVCSNVQTMLGYTDCNNVLGPRCRDQSQK